MKKVIEYQPKYKQIKEILKERIVKGIYSEGEKMPSENQLVEEFGVSKHTILKALTELINESYVYRIQGKGTFVCEKKKRKKNKIAIIVYHSENIYFSKIIRGAEDFAKENNYHLILCNSVGDFEKETSYIKNLVNEVDGFLIGCVYVDNEISEGVKSLIKNKFPFVFISHIPPIANINKYDYVIPDNFGGFYNLAKHLIVNGYKNFVFITIKNGLSRTEIKQRYEGYQKALIEAGIPETNSFIFETTDDDPMNGYIGDGYMASEKILGYLEKDKLCLVCVGDGLAMGVLEGLRKKGIKIPEQVGITGFDDIDILSKWGIGLTTVATPLYEMGKEGARILIDKIENSKHKKTQLILPVELKIRGTTITNNEKNEKDGEKI